MNPKNCDSCLMPLKKSPIPREHPRYCSHCFANGKFTYPGKNVKEFQAQVFKKMRAHGMPWIAAKFLTFVIRFAPRWKK